MADCTTLQTRLLEAELAHHKLSTGTQEVEVEHEGMKIKYSMVSVDKLSAYIDNLRGQIMSQCPGLLTGKDQRRRAIYLTPQMGC
jgi:gpW